MVCVREANGRKTTRVFGVEVADFVRHSMPFINLLFMCAVFWIT